MLNNSLNKVLLKKFKKEKGYVININNLLGAKQYNDATANNFSSPIEESNLDFYRYFTKPFLGIKNNLNCLFLRKSKYFNKGRYSRNRQIYRTGVYLCFYVNIAVLYLLWYTFYTFSIRYTYLWWIFFLLPCSFVFSRSLKYNIFFPKKFFFFFQNYIKWVLFFFKKPFTLLSPFNNLIEFLILKITVLFRLTLRVLNNLVVGTIKFAASPYKNFDYDKYFVIWDFRNVSYLLLTGLRDKVIYNSLAITQFITYVVWTYFLVILFVFITFVVCSGS